MDRREPALSLSNGRLPPREFMLRELAVASHN